MLVLLPPIGLDRRAWQWTGLEGVVTPEYPGHGDRDPWPEGAMSFERIADETVRGLDGRLDLIGVSMGARVAQYISVRHPERVRSALFCASSTAGTTQSATQVESDARADEVRQHGTAGTVEQILERWFTADALTQERHPGVEYVRQRWLDNDPTVIAESWLLLRRNTVGDRLAEVRAPVTVLGGRQDRAATPEKVLGLYEQLPGPARLEIIPGPHQLPLEEPAAFAAAVHRHLAWVDEDQRRSS